MCLFLLADHLSLGLVGALGWPGFLSFHIISGPLFPVAFPEGLSNNVARLLTWDSGVLKAQKLKLSALRTGTESFPS